MAESKTEALQLMSQCNFFFQNPETQGVLNPRSTLKRESRVGLRNEGEEIEGTQSLGGLHDWGKTLDPEKGQTLFSSAPLSGKFSLYSGDEEMTHNLPI